MCNEQIGNELCKRVGNYGCVQHPVLLHLMKTRLSCVAKDTKTECSADVLTHFQSVFTKQLTRVSFLFILCLHGKFVSPSCANTLCPCFLALFTFVLNWAARCQCARSLCKHAQSVFLNWVTRYVGVYKLRSHTCPVSRKRVNTPVLCLYNTH